MYILCCIVDLTSVILSVWTISLLKFSSDQITVGLVVRFSQFLARYMPINVKLIIIIYFEMQISNVYSICSSDEKYPKNQIMPVAGNVASEMCCNLTTKLFRLPIYHAVCNIVYWRLVYLIFMCRFLANLQAITVLFISLCVCMCMCECVCVCMHYFRSHRSYLCEN